MPVDKKHYFLGPSVGPMSKQVIMLTVEARRTALHTDTSKDSLMHGFLINSSKDEKTFVANICVGYMRLLANARFLLLSCFTCLPQRKCIQLPAEHSRVRTHKIEQCLIAKPWRYCSLVPLCTTRRKQYTSQ